jgi:sulfide:quinone oxidoreductase
MTSTASSPSTPTDATRLDDVFAAGDVTAFPVKQGGLAAQQAEAAAATIAAATGADVQPRPFRPVLRGLVLTGGSPQYLRAELTGGTGDTSSPAQRRSGGRRARSPAPT